MGRLTIVGDWLAVQSGGGCSVLNEWAFAGEEHDRDKGICVLLDVGIVHSPISVRI